MFNPKPSFWNRRGNAVEVEDEPETRAEVSDKLGNLMSALDAGIAQSTAREKAIQAGRKRQMEAPSEVQLPAAASWVVGGLAPSEAPAATPAAPDASTAPAVAVATVAKEAPVSAPAVEKGVVVAEPTEPDTFDFDPATSKALDAIAEQRKAAEALLLEACLLEEKIKKEAATAAAVRAYQAMVKKAERAETKAQAAGVAEKEAAQEAATALKTRALLDQELKTISEAANGKRAEADAANAVVAQLEQQLAEAQRAAQVLGADVEMNETRRRECLKKHTAAAQEVSDNAARTSARRAEREAAEAEAQTLRERAQTLKGQLPSASETGAIENVQRLAEKIAEQVQLSKHSSNGTATVK